MVQWAEALAAKPDDLYGKRRNLTIASCPLTSIYRSWHTCVSLSLSLSLSLSFSLSLSHTHTHTYTHNQSINHFSKKGH